eukprot:scaffold84467_cov69-Phaeocystis_antarctica.AAC.3
MRQSVGSGGLADRHGVARRPTGAVLRLRSAHAWHALDWTAASLGSKSLDTPRVLRFGITRSY